jgi:SAM-dependent methyltransferase
VSHLPQRLYREAVRTLRNPRRVLSVVDRRKLFAFLQSFRNWGAWDTDKAKGLSVRTYKSYDDYMRHQISKLKIKDLSKYDILFRQALRERLTRTNAVQPGVSVLCLAARLGTEVKAFMDLGCFAVGIDLNPGNRNRYVLPGDFHDIQFPDASIDAVFTNSLDHAVDIDRLTMEVRRVLKPRGLFFVEAALGAREGSLPGSYESFWWSTTQDLIDLLESHSFRLLQRFSFDYPWRGEHMIFRCPGQQIEADPTPTGG